MTLILLNGAKFLVESIYTYALLKTLYDKGEDYIDSFWPFILKLLEKHGSIKKDDLSEMLSKEYGFSMPTHVFETIYTRLGNKKYVNKSGRYCELNSKGKLYLDKLEDEKMLEREINSLIEDIYEFSISKDYEISREKIEILLYSVLNDNILDIIYCINPNWKMKDGEYFTKNDERRIIEDYIKIANDRIPEHYNTLRDMVFGSLISLILYTKGYLDLISLRDTEQKVFSVMYIDTNLVFSFLGLHPEEFVKSANQLHKLMKDNGIQLKVFSFTVDEICNVINGYLSQHYKYTDKINVSSIYNTLKVKGWTKSSARDFIINIETILSNLEIEIEWYPEIKLNLYKPEDKEYLLNIIKYKPDQNIPSQNHDILAIEKIMEIRGNPTRRLENAKAFFLTSDKKLNEFDLIEMSHRENGTICETILDRTLTNLLWLNNPDANPSLSTVMSIYSGSTFVKSKIWNVFYKQLLELQKTGKINENDITMLLYYSDIEAILSSYDETEVEDITPKLIFDEIESADEKLKAIESEIELKYKQQLDVKITKLQDEMKQELDEYKQKTEELRETQWYAFYRDLKTNARKRSMNMANNQSTLYSLFIISIYIIFIIEAWIYANKIDQLEVFKLLILLFGGGSSLKLYPSIKTKIYDRLLNNIYTQELKKLNIKELDDVH